MKRINFLTERKKRVERTESERYIDSMHSLGRIGALGAAAVMLGMPVVLGLVFDAMPSVGTVLQAAVPLLAIFLPSNLFEVLTYTPILGSSVYLTLITGEVINLKLPVANGVMRAMKLEAGTEEADVFSTIAVCTASFVTALVVAAGVALMVPLRPVLTAPAVKTMAANVIPAMFGALLAGIAGRELGGGATVRGRLYGTLPAAALTVLIIIFDAEISSFLRLDRLLGRPGEGVLMTSLQGFVIIALMPITHFLGKWMYRRGYIAVTLPGESEAPRGKGGSG